MPSKHLQRKDDRVIIHFDYDCFYASVFEAENPTLKTQPLAVQQKQIIVTCNYEARRRGLYKLQRITEARSTCPEAVIVLGEDLTRFRDASKSLYQYLRSFVWAQKAEKCGFDEVWLDVTSMIEYNLDLLNHNSLSQSFFCLSQTDPLQGFAYDATKVAGHTYPKAVDVRQLLSSEQHRQLTLRLILGSHLAMHIRLSMEEKTGYTSTVGIGTSKLISKLIGNVNKPKGQTTLLPPYDTESSNIYAFLDAHDIGKIPYIGFKLAQKLRERVLGRSADFAAGLVYGGTREHVDVGQVRLLPDLSAEMLEKLFAGPGMTHGIGLRVYQLVNGVDNTEVADARNVPRQISIEDSYIRLDTMDQVIREMTSLSTRLIDRMRVDLTEDGEWLGRPCTLRLTTRPRLPLNADGSRTRTFNRISRSTSTPSFMFSFAASSVALATQLVQEILMPLFKKLHPERDGWNLSLVNVAVTGMEEKQELGTDISTLFKKQEDHRKMWDSEVLPFVEDDIIDNADFEVDKPQVPGDDYIQSSQDIDPDPVDIWEAEDDDDDEDMLEGNEQAGYQCPVCNELMPGFAQAAHERFHENSTSSSQLH